MIFGETQLDKANFNLLCSTWFKVYLRVFANGVARFQS